jgi:hypothetical protein
MGGSAIYTTEHIAKDLQTVKCIISIAVPILFIYVILSIISSIQSILSFIEISIDGYESYELVSVINVSIGFISSLITILLAAYAIMKGMIFNIDLLDCLIKTDIKQTPYGLF